jgi:hypothetical protein
MRRVTTYRDAQAKITLLTLALLLAPASSALADALRSSWS